MALRVAQAGAHPHQIAPRFGNHEVEDRSCRRAPPCAFYTLARIRLVDGQLVFEAATPGERLRKKQCNSLFIRGRFGVSADLQ